MLLLRCGRFQDVLMLEWRIKQRECFEKGWNNYIKRGLQMSAIRIRRV